MSNIYTVTVKAEILSEGKWFDVEVPLAYTAEAVQIGNPKPYEDALARLRKDGHRGEVICYDTTPYKLYHVVEVGNNG